jgi:hypothetical protein
VANPETSGYCLQGFGIETGEETATPECFDGEIGFQHADILGGGTSERRRVRPGS